MKSELLQFTSIGDLIKTRRQAANLTMAQQLTDEYVVRLSQLLDTYIVEAQRLAVTHNSS
ncbi:aspartyl-phosphate phosphatase Spo0E family protein [Paenibacillus sp. MER TA 81-3]|uniref:aspartyl-phosphate phosphatase Spo0E family protein n=1 Tax=Paenibacillus sp. MER TA 81-3 TaxID=2939573 RepID=UPI00203CD697|nr:aspartyl-phosphate phosphatase Spo0E family protein [Paenibacillus sp. MER TA 81-3]MCM3342029.1 aspartyl-phosphate phosphatase Spo0E family protein [Paenibacillus sp. MER TA 81-3]